MRRRALFLTVLFLLATGSLQPLFGQKDSLLIDYLLQRIQQQQVKSNGKFLKGLFPSYITGKEKFKDVKGDNSIFFTGLISYTLMKLKPSLNSARQKKIDSIVSASLSAFPHFKNQKGRNTYNFWRTDTITIYPYAGWLFDKSITLPDDMDDTVLSLMVQQADDSIARQVHKLMQSFTNNGSARIANVIPSFRTINAYSTWFGKKFPVVFDVSVLCNVLTFVQSYNIEWTEADSASINLIVETIENDYHINKPIYVSPYYPKPSLILYHISRLMKIKPIPALENLKLKLIADAATIMQQSENFMERIICANAILNWGYIPPQLDIPAIEDVHPMVEENGFSFFLGNIPSYFTPALKKIATEKQLGMFYHYCPAYYDVLLLEYLILSN